MSIMERATNHRVKRQAEASDLIEDGLSTNYHLRELVEEGWMTAETALQLVTLSEIRELMKLVEGPSERV